MKKIIALMLAVVMVLAMVAAMTGCAKKTDEQKLTIWINGKDSYISSSEQELPQDQWYISKAISRFEQANPGVKVELIVSADGETAHQTFKADAMANTAPDMANLWTGQNIIALEDVITDISGLIPAEDKENITGWDAVTSPSGKILGYPTSDNQVCFYMYNKQIIAECGLDFENNAPKTMEEFDAACEAIAAKGYTPIVSDESFPWYGCYIMPYWWVQKSGMDRIISDCEGKTKFAEDEGLLEALELYRSHLDKGYLNSDALTSANSWNKFCSGEAAMTPRESSVVADAEAALGAENVGIFLPPDVSGAQYTGKTIGGPGQCIVVSKDCKNPELAVKFLHFLNSKEEVLEFLKVQPKIPTRTDITAEELGYKEGSVSADLFGYAGQTVYWIDNSLYPSVSGDFYNLLPAVLGGKMSALEFAQDLDNCVANAK